MPRRSILASMLALGVSMGIVVGTSAQTTPHPARIIEGTCSEPGTTVLGLSDVSASASLDHLAAGGIARAVEALGEPVAASLTIVPLALADMVAQERAIIVDVRAGDSASVVCGEIGGYALQGADVQIGLTGIGGLGARGVAWLHANDDGTTAVTILVAPVDSTGMVTAVGAHEDVVIRESLYLPEPFVVQRGTTVTWTNEDRTPHTATATDGAFDSGYLGQGDSYSLTFDSPGTFAYFCAYHPRMRATITVE
jgi:plastocyanin